MFSIPNNTSTVPMIGPAKEAIAIASSLLMSWFSIKFCMMPLVSTREPVIYAARAGETLPFENSFAAPDARNILAVLPSPCPTEPAHLPKLSASQLSHFNILKLSSSYPFAGLNGTPCAAGLISNSKVSVIGSSNSFHSLPIIASPF